MNKPVRNRVVTTKEELEAEQRAKRLQQQGMAAFGDPNQKFNLSSDMGVPPVVEEPVQQEVEETQAVEEPEQEEENQLSDDPATRMDQVSKIFSKNNPGFPSGQTLLSWKNMAGNIFILDAGENVFIYRYLKRQEWIQMNQDASFLKQRVDQREDTIFNRCVLWPKLSPEKIAALPAGAISSIVAQIEQQSMFIDPRELTNVTIKL